MTVSISAKTLNCEECGQEFNISHTCCPHCGRPGMFPNVTLAGIPEEKDKLTAKRNASLLECKSKNTFDIAASFEDACKKSRAVFTFGVQKLFRMIGTGTDIRETYYDLERLVNRTSPQTGKNWSTVRPQAEAELLGGHHNVDKIHYAALTLGDNSLNYGNCKVFLREEMIAHRSSCFEGNTAVIYSEKHSFSEYARSSWSDRHELCTVAFSGDLRPDTSPSDFPSILVQAGATALEDKFIEIHVFGPMTCRTFEEVSFDVSKCDRLESSLIDGLRDKLMGSNVRVR